jgi:hypothetical protein
MGFLLSCCKTRTSAKEHERNGQVLMEGPKLNGKANERKSAAFMAKSRSKREIKGSAAPNRSNGRVIELVEGGRSPFQVTDDSSPGVEPSVLGFFEAKGPASEKVRLITHADTEDEGGIPGEMDSSDDP